MAQNAQDSIPQVEKLSKVYRPNSKPTAKVQPDSPAKLAACFLHIAILIAFVYGQMSGILTYPHHTPNALTDSFLKFKLR